MGDTLNNEIYSIEWLLSKSNPPDVLSPPKAVPQTSQPGAVFFKSVCFLRKHILQF